MPLTDNNIARPEISVAPMMDWTDRHCRFFHRLIAPHVTLYTEMLTTGAIIHGDRDRFLRFNGEEHPVAMQLGGDNPAALAECAKICADYGYDEINLNCGCPSDRVQSGNFGACLMSQPELVAKCVEAMREAVTIPVTVKCRIAIDEYEEFSFLNRFIDSVSNAGCQKFIIHARKAWLQGLSPKENRDVPPLRYDIVREIKALYGDLHIAVNGGVKTLDDINKFTHRPSSLSSPRRRGSISLTAQDSGFRRNDGFTFDGFAFDGVMIGREAYQNPYFLAAIEHDIFKNENIMDRVDIARAMIPYIERQNRDYGTPVKSITRHMTGLFKAQTGGAIWRRYLSENAHKDGVTGKALIEGALSTLMAAAEKRAA